MNHQVTVIYSGRVQGVGFRYTTERIARHFPVTGYVKNLADGNVEVLAEGEETALREFLNAIRMALQHYIRDQKETWADARARYQEFNVAF